MLGAALLWYVAACMVAAVPAGLALAAHAAVARRHAYCGLGDRTMSVIMGLGLAASAASVIHLFGAAFAAVAL